MKRSTRPRFGRSLRGAIVGAFCGLAAWAVAQQPLLRGLEDWLQDAGFAWRGARPSVTKVLVVGIDDATLAILPRPMAALSPELAAVVTYLKDHGASAVGLDLTIPDTLDEYDREHGLDGWALGRAAALAGNVVLPVLVGDDGRSVAPLQTWQTGPPLALVEVTPDADHIVRRQQLAGTLAGRAYDQFALALLDVAGLAGADRAGDLQVDSREVPLDDSGWLRINFLGPPGTVPELSFAKILEAARASGPPPDDHRGRPADLDGAVVIVGATAHSLGDYHATPYANGALPALLDTRPRLMSGPELHANVIATLADGAFITTPWWLAPLPWVLILSAALGWAFARLTLLQGFLLAFAHHWAWKVVAIAGFWWGSWRVEAAAMLMAGVLVYGAIFALRWRRLRAGMRGVVKGDVLARLLEDEASHPGLRGEERVVTVLFADIRGFTSWSRRHSPREAVDLINVYLGAMIPVVEDCGGMVDKYIGDGIMAIFNAPDDQPDHAERAVEAAVAMVRRARELGPVWARHDFPDFRIGIGIATGPALVGMVGGRRRLDYTAIGETVNAAARIESANKELRSEVLIAAHTQYAVDPAVLSRLGCAGKSERVAASGIPEGLEVYRVNGLDSPGSAAEASSASSIGLVSKKEPTA
jgi:class 3 adenylate cyclase/CHASE2 domain-containing sensor protein